MPGSYVVTQTRVGHISNKRRMKMVKLKAIKKNGSILISEGSFQHLLNCLANQKFVGEMPINGDSVSVGKEEYDRVQNSMQDAIDDFYKQCMDLLISKEPSACGEGCEECGS